ncbi:MAG: sigma factor, partial [Planctomycetota bacterium]
MRAEYSNPAIRQLRDQLMRQAAGDQKIAKADLAEKLLGELDPKQTYSCGYLCSRLANSPLACPPVSVTGSEASRDLRVFVQERSDAANVPAEEAGEPVLTLEDLSRQLSVSTKTISRWRQQGLVSRRFVFDGRKRVGFLQSSVERFLRQNRDRVERAAQFSQMNDSQRQEIIASARRLVESGRPTSRITGQLAQQTGRSVETVRYVLRQYDRAHPDEAILPPEGGAMSERAKREIYQRYRCGESAEALGRRFNRSRTSIYRVLAEMRLEQIRQLPLDYMPNEQFERVRSERQEQEILAPAPASEEPPRKVRRPVDLPPYLASLYETPLLTRQQEAHLFRKMNYLKYKAARLRARLDPERPSAALMDRIEELHEGSVVAKNEIIRANLRLVVSIAKRRVGPAQELFDLVSDGNMSLIRAVEKFDFARG